MSDLSDLHGIYPTSLRWNAEDGFLAIAAFNAETGERELKEIELGQPATFALDLATRQRGYGLIKVGFYEMKLTPVGEPPPPWPEDEEYKPPLGCWLWNPTFGELRLETNASMFREAVTNLWDECRSKRQAAAGEQPVIRFTNRVSVLIRALNKSFYRPLIELVGWIERGQVPGWAERPPTVLPPKTLPVLPASTAPTPSAPAAPATPVAKRSHKARAKAKVKAQASDPDDAIDDILGDDPIPYA